MPSLFPDLFSYSMLGVFAVRLILGSTLLTLGIHEIKRRNAESSRFVLYAGILKALAGAIIVLGLGTQVGAIIAIVVLGIHIALKIKNRQFLSDGINYYAILFVLSLAILVLGPGAFAFDLPL
jgi:uncharacterized membrane protein YphA (DoxX/SURF4 family)